MYLGILEWWGYMTNERKLRAKIFRPHPKTTPIFIVQEGNNMTTDCIQAVRRVVSQLVYNVTTTIYHQPLSYVNQCISMAKHISSTTFYIVTDHLGVATPLDPPLHN